MEICMQHMKSIMVFKSVYNSDYIPIIGEFDLLKMRQDIYSRSYIHMAVIGN